MNTTTEPDNNNTEKYNFIKRLLLKYRVGALIIFAGLGVCLALWWFVDEAWLPSLYPFGEVAQFKKNIGIEKGKWLDSSLTTIFLALPTLFILWLFRTHDTRVQIEKTTEQIEKTQEQIEKTQEQIEKTQINTLTSMLNHGLDMITSNEFKRRYAGLMQLGLLKKQTKIFNAQIDSATRNLDLTPVDVNSKPLEEGGRIPSNYQRALLIKAPLKGMDLSGAKFRGANLEFADLTGADLKGAIFNEAKFNNKTKFPKSFNPKANGMINVDD